MSELFHSFEFNSSFSDVGNTTIVYIDGKPLKGVYSATVDYHYKDFPRVTLRLFANEVKVKAEEAEVDEHNG